MISFVIQYYSASVSITPVGTAWNFWMILNVNQQSFNDSNRSKKTSLAHILSSALILFKFLRWVSQSIATKLQYLGWPCVRLIVHTGSGGGGGLRALQVLSTESFSNSAVSTIYSITLQHIQLIATSPFSNIFSVMYPSKFHDASRINYCWLKQYTYAKHRNVEVDHLRFVKSVGEPKI